MISQCYRKSASVKQIACTILQLLNYCCLSCVLSEHKLFYFISTSFYLYYFQLYNLATSIHYFFNFRLSGAINCKLGIISEFFSIWLCKILLLFFFKKLLLLHSRQVRSDSFLTPWTIARQSPLPMGFQIKLNYFNYTSQKPILVSRIFYWSEMSMYFVIIVI